MGFGIWEKNMDMRGKTGIFICTSRYLLDPVKHYGAFFQQITGPETLTVFRGGVPAKTFYFYECTHLKERYPTPY